MVEIVIADDGFLQWLEHGIGEAGRLKDREPEHHGSRTTARLSSTPSKEAICFAPSIVEFYQLLGGRLKDAGWGREHMSKNRLAILPDLTHDEIGAAPAFGHAVLTFLNGASGAKSRRD